jgi:aspartate racemase
MKKYITGIANKFPIIGVVGVTIPGALDCISKINSESKNYFPAYQHPHIVLHQLSFKSTHDAQEQDNWNIVEDNLLHSLQEVSKLGADFAIIPANTVHRLIDNLKDKSPVTIISMLDVVAEECKRQNIKKLGILGTSWTMKDHLYKTILAKNHIEEVTPSLEDQNAVQQAIFSELIPHGKVCDQTLGQLIAIVQKLKALGCDGIALACTELPLVLNDENCNIKTIDTTNVLAKAAVKRAHELHLPVPQTSTSCKSVENFNKNYLSKL